MLASTVAIMVIAIASMALVFASMQEAPPDGWRMTPAASATGEWDAERDVICIRLGSIIFNDVAFGDVRLMVVAPDLSSTSFSLADLLWEAGNRTAPLTCQGLELTMTAVSTLHCFASGDAFELRGAQGDLGEGSWRLSLVYLPSGGEMLSVQVDVG
jgi:hypothetical protein